MPSRSPFQLGQQSSCLMHLVFSVLVYFWCCDPSPPPPASCGSCLQLNSVVFVTSQVRGSGVVVGCCLRCITGPIVHLQSGTGKHKHNYRYEQLTTSWGRADQHSNYLYYCWKQTYLHLADSFRASPQHTKGDSISLSTSSHETKFMFHETFLLLL